MSAVEIRSSVLSAISWRSLSEPRRPPLAAGRRRDALPAQAASRDGLPTPRPSYRLRARQAALRPRRRLRPSPEQMVTYSNRSATCSSSSTSRSARSAPSGPDRQRCRAVGYANATVWAARWLHATTRCASNPGTTAARATITASTSSEVGEAVPIKFSMSTKTMRRPALLPVLVFVMASVDHNHIYTSTITRTQVSTAILKHVQRHDQAKYRLTPASRLLGGGLSDS